MEMRARQSRHRSELSRGATADDSLGLQSEARISNSQRVAQRLGRCSQLREVLFI